MLARRSTYAVFFSLFSFEGRRSPAHKQTHLRTLAVSLPAYVAHFDFGVPFYIASGVNWQIGKFEI